jgi:hypothetical protein
MVVARNTGRFYSFTPCRAAHLAGHQLLHDVTFFTRGCCNATRLGGDDREENFHPDRRTITRRSVGLA